ncbi:LPS translocon maturation chaperone LptM [Hydrocarboniphaga effusa]|uniref:LPS translocon maturation chaperone LptM n=1 Tax=Hydrocarboniphaga effusa TaxID=243629 RepID=UPI00398BE189
MRFIPRLAPRRSMPLLAFCAVLSACGQTGPLYLPGEVPESEKPPSQRNKERVQGKPNAQQPEPASTEPSTGEATPANTPTTDAPATP